MEKENLTKAQKNSVLGVVVKKNGLFLSNCHFLEKLTTLFVFGR